jgi:hypothetical protein
MILEDPHRRAEPTLALMSRIAAAAGFDLAVTIVEPDHDERKARLSARSLTDEERLRQNESLSRLAVAAGGHRDA